MIETDILEEIAAERAAQLLKWGQEGHPAGKWSLILAEEFGEVAKAALELRPMQMRAELVQLAAVAVAWIESIDRRGN